MKIRVIMTGRSYHLAEQLPSELELPEASTVDDAVRALRAQLPPDAGLPDSCLMSVAGQHLGTLGKHEPRPLVDGDELLLIAPVAGG